MNMLSFWIGVGAGVLIVVLVEFLFWVVIEAGTKKK